MFDIDNYEDEQSYEEDAHAAMAQKELEEQQRWEEENNVDSLLSKDPGYIAWADEMDRQTAEDRKIMDLAAVEDERNFRTSSAWD